MRPAPAAGASQSGRDEPLGERELRRRLFHVRGPGNTSMSADDAEALRAIKEDIFLNMNPGGGAPAEEALGDEGGRPGRSGQWRHHAGEDPLEEPLAEWDIPGGDGPPYQPSLDGYSPYEHNGGGAARSTRAARSGSSGPSTTSARRAALKAQLAALTSSSDDDDGGANDDGSESPPSPPSRRGKLRLLPSTEARTMNTDLEPGTIVAWADWILPVLLENYKPLKSHFHEELNIFLATRAKYRAVRQADQLLARQLAVFLNPAAKRVITFKLKLTSDDAAEREAHSSLPPRRESGHRFFRAMLDSERIGDGAAALIGVDAFKAKDFGFTDPAADMDDLQGAANALRAHWRLLPDSERKGKYGDIRFLLAKMPDSIAEERDRHFKKVLEKLASDKKPKYTYEEYATKMTSAIIAARVGGPAMHIRSATSQPGPSGMPPAPPPPHAIFNPHDPYMHCYPIEGKGKGKGGKGKGGGGFFGGGRGGQRDGGGGQVGRPCAICASASHSHFDKHPDGTYVCVAKCKDCDRRYCLGARAPFVCVGKMDTLPPREKCLNGQKKEYSPELYDRLKKLKAMIAEGRLPPISPTAAHVRSATLGGDAGGASDGAQQAMVYMMPISLTISSAIVTDAETGIALTLLDTGADCNFSSDPRLYEAATEIKAMPYVISGVSGSKTPTGEVITVMMSSEDGSGAKLLPFVYTPASPGSRVETVVSDGYLRQLGYTTDANSLYWPGGGSQPIEYVQSGWASRPFVRLGFIEGRARLPPSGGAELHLLPSTAARPHLMGKKMESLLWAAKTNLGSSHLKRLHLVANAPELTMDGALTASIDDNSVRRRALEKRVPVAVRMAPKDKTMMPGHTLIVDGYTYTPGYPCVLSGGSYDMQAIDACSIVAISIECTKLHRTTEWSEFFARAIAMERAIGHEPRVGYMDADSIAAGLQAYLAKYHQFDLRIGAAGHHEWVGAIEVLSGSTIERRAEMTIMRAGKDPRYLPAARRQVWFTHARCPTTVSEKSPLEIHTGRKPDLLKYAARGGLPIPLCACTYLLDETARGPKGSERGRSQSGTFMYIDTAESYVIMASSGHKVTRWSISTTNEHALALEGLPNGGAMIDVATQIVPDDAPPLTLLQQPRPTASAAPPPAKILIVDPHEAPVGAHIKVWWRDAKGPGGRWYDGTVIKYDDECSPPHHIIKYDGFDQTYRHDLANDRVTGKLPWFVVKSKQLPPTAVPITRAVNGAPPTDAIGVGPRTRLQSRLHARAATIINESSNPLASYNALAFQLLPGDSNFHAMHESEIDTLLDVLLEVAEHDEHDGDINTGHAMAPSDELAPNGHEMVHGDGIAPDGHVMAQGDEIAPDGHMMAQGDGIAAGSPMLANSPAERLTAESPRRNPRRGTRRCTRFDDCDLGANKALAHTMDNAQHEAAKTAVDDALFVRSINGNIDQCAFLARANKLVAEKPTLIVHDPSSSVLLNEVNASKAWSNVTDITALYEVNVSKASSNVIDITTDVGIVQMTAPATAKQLKESPQRTQWEEADRKALEISILGFGGNKLVPITQARESGSEVAESVVQRRIKTENGRLAKNDPFKSRIALDSNRLNAKKLKQGKRYVGPTHSLNITPLGKRRFISDAADRQRTLVKVDVGNAYPRAPTKRGKRHQRVPEHLRTYDEDGTELVIELSEDSAMWGEASAGFEWDSALHDKLTAMGWRRAEGVPGLWNCGEATMITEVDDLLISEPVGGNYQKTAATIYLLDQRFKAENPDAPGIVIKWDVEPEVYAGYEMARSSDRDRLTLTQRGKFLEAVRAHVPQAADDSSATAKKLGLYSGNVLTSKLRELRLKRPANPTRADREYISEYAGLVGHMRWLAETTPALETPLRFCASVASGPDPDQHAYEVAQSVLFDAYKHHQSGLTYGGQRARAVVRPDPGVNTGDRVDGDNADDGHAGASGVTLAAGAPLATEGHADATWGLVDETGSKDIMGLLITSAGAAILAKSCTLRPVTASSSDAEGHASVKLTDSLAYIEAVENGLGVRRDYPYLVTTDNKGNQLVSNGESSASRCRHQLRRWWIISQRINAGSIKMRSVPTAECPADFLTKFIDGAKAKASLEYATNSAAAVAATGASFREQEKAKFLSALAIVAAKLTK